MVTPGSQQGVATDRLGALALICFYCELALETATLWLVQEALSSACDKFFQGSLVNLMEKGGLWGSRFKDGFLFL